MRSLDREATNLLRAAEQLRPTKGAEKIRELSARILDWEGAIAGAREHGVLPLLYSALRAADVTIPHEAMEKLRREFDRNAFHCIANAAELLDVLKIFEGVSIPAIPFKGVVLGASAY